MRAVWSFWSKPYRAARVKGWASDWHHWLAWGLSVHAARQHYPDTRLVTDTPGRRVLVDLLGLPFVHVSTALDAFDDADPDWWALGKLEAYRQQGAPFVHIDADVFLWRPLGGGLETAAVLAQNPEPIRMPGSPYRPDVLEAALEAAGGWLPPAWRWYRAQPAQRGECCGVFGGCAVGFIRDYAEGALRLALDPANRTALVRLGGKEAHMILLEQYLLAACLEYNAVHVPPPFGPVDIRYVFADGSALGDPAVARGAGYTHLAAGTKSVARVCRELERRVADDLPIFHARATRHAAAIADALAGDAPAAPAAPSPRVSVTAR